ncbi:BTB/POZ domain-containing protein 9-like [Adelges cooleyi]|uniref:BTB/POZ domain-containing protein 9-like n=1 Tax=Adelges cooleyi TaxID=133065 RepID=UPI0021809201|nr:BTB/POZ domain-containing protein 9-like [Adelges cooleyi]
MLIFFLVFIILWSTPVCSVPEQIDITQFSANDISNLYLSDSFSDVFLVVDGERLPAHRSLLASSSKYFKGLLYGGHKETYDSEVKISEAPVTLFKILLEYIYTGRINISTLEDNEVFEFIRISDFFGFPNLKLPIYEYLKSNIDVNNVCSFFAFTRRYPYKELVDESLNFIDKNALEVMQKEDFLSLPSEALQEILNRDTFFVNELVIFRAVCRWIKEKTLDHDTKIKVLSAVRYPLMSNEELSEARQSQVVSSDNISEAIQFRNTWSPANHQFRGQQNPNVDLVSSSQKFPFADDHDGGTTMIKLHIPSFINYIEISLWFDYMVDRLTVYSYYIEVSMDQQDWIRVLDYSKYNCRFIQRLWIQPRIVRYIHFVGTNSSANASFKIWGVQYKTKNMQMVDIENGLVVPTNDNVTSKHRGAGVINGESSINNGSLLEDFSEHYAKYGKSYFRYDRYTYHRLGSGFILVHLAQPYILSSMRLLLWGGKDQFYIYKIEGSLNNQDWEMISNKNKLTQSWQVLEFLPIPVLYIRITGISSSTGTDFRCVYLEAPAQENNDTDTTMTNALTHALVI